MKEKIYEYLKTIDFKTLSMKELHFYYEIVKDYENEKKHDEEIKKFREESKETEKNIQALLKMACNQKGE